MRSLGTWRRWPPAVGWVAAGVVLAALLFGGVLFEHLLFADRDMVRVYLPLHAYWAERIREHALPLWYPYDGFGQPFLADVLAAPLHPVNLLFLVLPPWTALQVAVLVCYPAAFAATAALARSLGCTAAAALFAAVVYTASGYLVGISNSLSYLMAAATVPGALWGVRRLHDAVSAARLGMAVLLLDLILFAGDPEAFVLTCTLSAVLLITLSGVRRGLALAAGLLGLVALTSMVQWLPSLLAASASSILHRDLSQAERWSLHPLELVEMLLGPLFTMPSVRGDNPGVADHLLGAGFAGTWVPSVFIGAVPVALALLAAWQARRSRSAQAGALAALVVLALALGSHAGAYAMLYRWLPGWSTFRYPEKLVPFLVLIIAVGAGFGLDALEEPSVRRRAAVVTAAAGALAAATAGAEVGLGAWSRGVLPLWWADIPTEFSRQLGANLEVWAVSAAAGCLGVAAAMALRPSWGRGAVGAVVLLLLVAASPEESELVPASALSSPSPLVGRAHEAGAGLGRDRLWTTPHDLETAHPLSGISVSDVATLVSWLTLAPDVGGLGHLESADGYLPLCSDRTLSTVEAAPPWFGRSPGVWGVGQIIGSQEEVRPGGVDPASVEMTLPEIDTQLHRAAGLRPRAYLARPRCVGSRSEAERTLADARVDLGVDRAVVECDHPLPAASGDLGRATVTSYAPERVSVDVEASADSVLVLNDADLPGWEAQIDGSTAPILPANVIARGVAVAAGHHTVVFTYHLPGLGLGVLVSALAWLALLAAAIWRH